MELYKLLFLLTFIAVTTGRFSSCEKTVSESETHSQTFTLGETTYDINNAYTVENINDSLGNIYNAVVLGQGQLIGTNGGESRAVILVFNDDIESGTYTMSNNPSNYPKYYFIEMEVEDIVNFSLDDLMNQEDFYVANSGSFTLEKDGDVFTITTDGIEVEKINDASVVETSSVDLESDVLSYVLPTIEEGNVDGVNIITSGIIKMKMLMVDTYIVAFLTEYGDMIGLISQVPLTNGIPEDAYSYIQYPIVYIPAMNIDAPNFASWGEIRVTRDNNIYNIDMKDLEFSDKTISRLHYVGEMVHFDFTISIQK